MKQLLAFALALPALTSQAQGLTNAGNTITVELGTTLYVAGTVQNTASSTLTNAGTLQVTGDFRNAGTLVSNGTLLFSGTTNQAFMPGTASVATLLLNNTGDKGQRTLNLPTNLTITSALTLQSGLLRTAPLATVTLLDGATLSGEAPGQYVQGNLRIMRAAGSGVLDFGHGLVLDRSGLGNLSATRTAGLLTDDLSRGVHFGPTAATGIDRIWTATTEIAPTAPVPVTLQWLADDDNGLTAFSQLQAWRADLGTANWAMVGNTQAATISGSTRSFSFNTLALGRLTVSSTSVPLPVTLISFTAQATGSGTVRVAWETASEQNSARFEVERSVDGTTFTRIGQVPAAGSSSTARAYELPDSQLPVGVTLLYYRLKQVDANGIFSYSLVRTVAVKLATDLALFPNPTHTASTLTGAAPGAHVQVFDALGRLVATTTANAAGTAALLLPVGLPSGLYVVQSGPGPALRLTVE